MTGPYKVEVASLLSCNHAGHAWPSTEATKDVWGFPLGKSKNYSPV
jgi:hypothetical protein